MAVFCSKQTQKQTKNTNRHKTDAKTEKNTNRHKTDAKTDKKNTETKLECGLEQEIKISRKRYTKKIEVLYFC